MGMSSVLPKRYGEDRRREVATTAPPYSRDRKHTPTDRPPAAMQLSSCSVTEFQLYRATTLGWGQILERRKEIGDLGVWTCGARRCPSATDHHSHAVSGWLPPVAAHYRPSLIRGGDRAGTKFPDRCWVPAQLLRDGRWMIGQRRRKQPKKEQHDR